MSKRLFPASVGILALLLTVSLASARGFPLIISFIDVGQGDSILVRVPGRHAEMLVDAGEQEAGPTVVQYLKDQDVDDIEYLVSTHPHSDHIGGMLDVLNAFKVEHVIDSGKVHGSAVQENYLAAIQAKGIPFKQGRAGQKFDLAPGITVSVLGPVKLSDEVNDCSVVLRIQYGKKSFLLMGDAQTDEEDSILATGVSLSADVLKVGHHGSSSSTSQAWLNAGKPKYAIISCGQSNSYGHPHREILTRLAGNGVKVIRTDLQGTVVVTWDGSVMAVKAAGKQGLSSGGMPAGAVLGTVVSSGNYIGNANTHKFHRPTCSYLPDPKNRVYFGNRDEAIKAGYVPCKKCNP